MFEDVKAVWTAMLAQGGARQRLLDGHHLHLYYGADTVSRPIFFLITRDRPSIPQLSKVVAVDTHERSDGSWIVALTLKGDLFADTFMGLCIELARQSNRGSNPEESLGFFTQTLEQWKEIFSRAGAKRLSLEQVRGLIGELSFALETLRSSLTPLELLNSWQGPFGTAQDFLLPSGELFEVKSIHSLSRWVKISSADQLDPLDTAPLALVVIPVEASAPDAKNSITLPTLVGSFRAIMEQVEGGAAALEQRLDLLGLDTLDDYYDGLHFTVAPPRFYDVSDDFPRIRRASVPTAVDQVVYRLRLSAIEPFEKEPDESGIWRPSNESEAVDV